MSGNFVFLGNADCPTCSALTGEACEQGFTAHDNCVCETEPGDCEREVHLVGAGGVEVEITCPDGTTAGISVPVDLSNINYSSWPDDPEADELIEAGDEAAEELCQETCK